MKLIKQLVCACVWVIYFRVTFTAENAEIRLCFKMKARDFVFDSLRFFIFYEVSTSQIWALVVSSCASHVRWLGRGSKVTSLMEHRRGQYLSGFGSIGFTFGNGLYRAIRAVARGLLLRLLIQSDIFSRLFTPIVSLDKFRIQSSRFCYKVPRSRGSGKKLFNPVAIM